MAKIKTPMEATKHFIRLGYKLNELNLLMADETKNAKEISRCEKELQQIQDELNDYNKTLAKKNK